MNGFDLAKSLTYKSWIDAWYRFLDLLDIDYNDGAECKECGPSPEIVVCDGTSLGFHKKFNLFVPKKTKKEGAVGKFR